MGIGASIRDLPRPLQGLALAGVVLLSAVAIVMALGVFVRSEARAAATTTTREVLSQDIETFKREAKSAAEAAAREGARSAVEQMRQQIVAPLATQVDKLAAAQVEDHAAIRAHIDLDQDRQSRTDQDIRDLQHRR